MKAMDAVKKVMELKNVRMADLTDMLGEPPRSAKIAMRFYQDNVSVAKLDEMLRVMGYKIVIMPRDVSVPKDSFRIE